MTPPKTVKVGPFEYTIALDKTPLRREGKNLNGLTDYDKELISVDPTLSPRMTRETVVHELLHTLTDMIGFRDECDNLDDEESLVRRLAPALLSLLGDNKTLVRYLTAAS